MIEKPRLVILGARNTDEVPGLSNLVSEVEFQCAHTLENLRTSLEGAEILLGWDFRADLLRDAWENASRLRWIHWAGVGVDPVLFRELVESEVILTNSRGVFDRAMAEYVLGLVLNFAKGYSETTSLQSEARWKHRLTERIDQKHALIVGVGSIGRAIGRMLKNMDLIVSGVGRRERNGDPDFERIYAGSDLNVALPQADYVIVVVPLTEQTYRMISDEQFKAMKPSARLINVGRGATVDESALITALQAGKIAGAALDVFENDPLPPESPLWSMPQVLISPHMSGDFIGYKSALANCFFENYHRYRANQPLLNIVDKSLGFIPGSEETDTNS
jgi:phosphoglycerate dehydrogenase-like enzyme